MSKGSKYKTLMSIRNKDRAATKTIIGQDHAILFYLLIICTVYKRHFVCIHISFYNKIYITVYAILDVIVLKNTFERIYTKYFFLILRLI